MISQFILSCLVYACIFGILVLVGGIEVDVDLEGNQVNQSPNNGRSVTFVSHYDGLLDLYWIGSLQTGK